MKYELDNTSATPDLVFPCIDLHRGVYIKYIDIYNL